MKQDISCPMCHTNDWNDDNWMPPPDEWLEYSTCKECGFDLVFKDQSRRSELRFKGRKAIRRITKNEKVEWQSMV